MSYWNGVIKEEFHPRPENLGGHEWWCPTCGEVVPNEHVTYEETHDERCGGCGGEVF